MAESKQRDVSIEDVVTSYFLIAIVYKSQFQ